VSPTDAELAAIETFLETGWDSSMAQDTVLDWSAIGWNEGAIAPAAETDPTGDRPS
jgi:hypothetical protein